MTDVHDLLRWAAGAAVSIPRHVTINEAEFLALLWQHRLPVRFTERVHRERPEWCGVALSVGAWLQAEHVTTHIQQQIAAADEIARTFSRAARNLRPIFQPPIFVKGFSSYALIGKAPAVRMSDDIDVLVAEPEQLLQTLIELGYHHAPINAPHEYAVLSRGGASVEIHDHIPSPSYPLELAAMDLMPSHHPGRWTQKALGYRQTTVVYADVLADAHAGRTPETQALFLPSPAMAAFLGCASLFRDYIGAPTYGYVQGALGFLAELVDLVRLPAFDREAFLALIDRFEGYDSTAFVDSLLAQHFGECLLPQPARAAPARAPSGPSDGLPLPFARQFFWCSAWALLDMTAEDLMHPEGGGAAMIDRIGANALRAAPSDRKQYYSIDAAGSGEAISRLLVQHSGSLEEQQHALPLWFSITKIEDTCVFEVCVLGPSAESSYEVNVFRPCPYPIWIHKEKLVHERQNKREITESKEGLVFTLRFPWSPFANASPLPYQPIILQIEKQTPAVENSTAPKQLFVTIPIHLYWQENSPVIQEPTLSGA